jgi:hypothetical protein
MTEEFNKLWEEKFLPAKKKCNELLEKVFPNPTDPIWILDFEKSTIELCEIIRDLADPSLMAAFIQFSDNFIKVMRELNSLIPPERKLKSQDVVVFNPNLN